MVIVGGQALIIVPQRLTDKMPQVQSMVNNFFHSRPHLIPIRVFSDQLQQWEADLRGEHPGAFTQRMSLHILCLKSDSGCTKEVVAKFSFGDDPGSIHSTPGHLVATTAYGPKHFPRVFEVGKAKIDDWSRGRDAYYTVYDYIAGEQAPTSLGELSLTERISAVNNIMDTIFEGARNLGFIPWDLVPRNFIVDENGVWKYVDLESVGPSFAMRGISEFLLEILKDMREECFIALADHVKGIKNQFRLWHQSDGTLERGIPGCLQRLHETWESLAGSILPIDEGPNLPIAIPETVLIPAGTFTMGKANNELTQPVREIVLNAFEIGRYPVTVAEYCEFVKATFRPVSDRLNAIFSNIQFYNHPVTGITWQDAVDYCNWLSEKTGETYRLPTEAEWERTARGKSSRRYPWGRDLPDASRVAFRKGEAETSLVGAHPAGATIEGVHDLAGNVWEWCGDWFGYYDPQVTNNPQGPQTGRKKVLRGGLGLFGNESFSGDYRNADDPKNSSKEIGFRVVKEVKTNIVSGR